MNFFNSVFADDPPRPEPEPESNTDNAPHNEPQNAPLRDSSPTTAGDGAWNFGGLIKTLTAKSESIIDVYRRDLQEFGTGLKKEIEVAHGSLETVGHVIDQFGNTVVQGTAQIISQGKDAILAVDLESDNSDSGDRNKQGSGKGLNSRGYSRFDAQVRGIQGDVSTYVEVPEDLDEFNEWKLGFSLEGKSEEMERFLRENDAMESVYKRVVPNIVDRETFWYRYYYKVYRVKKAEDVRARLVRRMSREEEELSWDVEDDDIDDVGRGEKGVVANKEVGGEKLEDGSFDADSAVGTKGLNVEKRENLVQSKELGIESVEESKVESSGVVPDVGYGSKGSIKEVDDAVKRNDSASAAGSDKKVVVESKAEDGESSLVAASQHEKEEEEDLGWDEIEDISGIDEKKTTRSGNPSKVDLRNRLSAAEEEEDLSWDIEDDDEPAKA